MAELVNFKAQRFSAGLKRLRATDPVLIEIVLALWELGGEAHRQIVVDHLLRGRGEAGVIRHDDRAPIYEAMASIFARAPHSSTWVAPVFNPTSYRWMLTESGRRLFQIDKTGKTETGMRLNPTNRA